MIDFVEIKKSTNVKSQVLEKGTIIDPRNITTWKDAYPIEVDIFSDVREKRTKNIKVTRKHYKYDKRRSFFKDTILTS